MTRNLYAGVLTGRLQEHVRQVSEYTPEEILMSNWHLIQAMLRLRIDQGGSMDRQAQVVSAALDTLVEMEQIEADYAAHVNTMLRGADLESITRISTASASLPMAAASVKGQGDLRRQVALLQDFLIQVLQITDDPDLRRAGVEVITRLKVEAGMPAGTLEQLVSFVLSAQPAETVDVESEGEEVDASG